MKELNTEHAIMSAHMVVFKFSMSRSDFQTIKSDIHMSLMDRRYVLIWFEYEKKLDMELATNYRLFLGINFKTFSWRLVFNTNSSQRIVPVWVEIPYLKYKLFSLSFFKAIRDE